MELDWSNVLERKYETGVDRGVLYPASSPGVAWTGLVSVSEGVSGGENTSEYYDGSKFADSISNEDFQATITALSAPPEFAACDGQAILAKGLYALKQPRTTFGFSYRTKIGNPLEGTDHGYKLHLVYNATASPSERTSTTIGDSVEVTALEWTVNSVPPRSSEFRPTAHIVFNSTKTDPLELLALENRLYGTESTRPYLPTQAEVFQIVRGEIKPSDPIDPNIKDNRLTMTSRGMIQRNGVNFRSGGFNAFQLITNDYPRSRIMSHDDIDRILNKAVALNAFVIRAHTLAASVGNTATLVRGTVGDGTDVRMIYDYDVWEAIEYAVYKAGQLGIYLIAPFVDELGYYHGGKRNWVNFRHPGSVSMDYQIKAANSAEQRQAENVFYTDPQIQLDFHRFIADWLNHGNRYTGRQFKNEPALSIVQVGNELWTAAQDAPGWVATQAQFIKSISPNTLVMDTGTDGLAVELMAWNSPYIDILETHPYTEFDGNDVRQMAKFAASKGKAFAVGEYAWAKSTAPYIEEVTLETGNIFFSAPWSLQNDEDLHNEGAPYGTSDDNSFYVPGKDATNSEAVDRLTALGYNMLESAAAAKPPELAPQGTDIYDQPNGTDWNEDLWRIDVPRAASGQPPFGNYARVQSLRGRLHVAPLGGYSGNAYVVASSRAPAIADQTVSFDLTPTTIDAEAYFRTAIRSKSFGPAIARETCYFFQIGNEPTGQAFVNLGVMLNGVETLMPGGGVRVPGWASGVPIDVEFSVIGSQIKLLINGTLVKSVINTSITGPGYTGFDIRGGAAKTAVDYDIDMWSLV